MDPIPQIETLTDAQKEVLRLCQRGMSTKEMASELGISADSVVDRIEGARAKLGGVRRQTAARLLAESEAYPLPFGGNPNAVGVSRTEPLVQSERAVAVDGKVEEPRSLFQPAPPEPYIARLGPLPRSLLIVLFTIAFLILAALLKPMVDGMVWLADMGRRLF